MDKSEAIEKTEFYREQSRKKQTRSGFNYTSIKELNLSNRAYNSLGRNNIFTIQEIRDVEEDLGLEQVKKLGKKSADEIREKIKSYKITSLEDRGRLKIHNDVRALLSLDQKLRLREKHCNISELVDMEENELKEYLHYVMRFGEDEISTIKDSLAEYKETESYKNAMWMIMQGKKTNDLETLKKEKERLQKLIEEIDSQIAAIQCSVTLSEDTQSTPKDI